MAESEKRSSDAGERPPMGLRQWPSWLGIGLAWLVARVPWNAAEHRIRAVAADEHVSKMLGLPRHAACLVIQRRTWSGDTPVTNVRLTYAGETHSLVARFAPQER